MQKFSDVLLDKNGKAIAGAVITVLTYPGGQPATIYAADGGPSVDSVKTDNAGRFAFYAVNGHYSIKGSGAGIDPFTLDDITLFDQNDLAGVSGASQVGAAWFNGVIGKLSDLAVSSGASLIGFIQAGAGWIARSIQSKLRESVSVYDAGVVADGDGLGGGSDQTAKFQAAIDAVAASNGGILRVPYAGTGFIRVSGQVNGAANVRIIIDDAMTIDCGATGAFRWNGSIGSEIAIAANVTRGDTIITTTAPHGLAVGDWFLLKGQRAALHADAGPDWRLGETTANTTSTFFAEPCQVLSVDSATQVTICTPLMFPNYRTDRTLETYSSARVSTIAKISFLRGAKVTGGRFTANGASPLYFNWCHEPEVEGVKTYLNKAVGQAVRLDNCLRGRVNAHARRDANFTIIADHSQYNSFKDVGSWWNTWNVEDTNGSQGIDVSFMSGMHGSICPDITMRAFFQKETAVKMHGGSYGGVVRVFAVGCKQSTVLVSARFVRIENPRIYGPTVNSLGSIRATGWGLVDGGVYGGVIESNTVNGYGIDLQMTGEVDTGPVRRNTTIDGVNIRNSQVGIYLRSADVNPATSAESGIVLRNIVFDGIVSTCINILPYVNGVTIRNVRANDMTGTGSKRVVYAQNNTVGHNVSGVTGTNADYLLNFSGIPDTTTFPTASYPNARHRIDIGSLVLSGSGQVAFVGTVANNRNADYTLQMPDIVGDVSMNATVARTITVPLNANIPFPIETSIVIRQLGVGDVTIAGEAGVTINSRNGLRLGGQYAVATLRKVSSDIWYLYGDTRV